MLDKISKIRRFQTMYILALQEESLSMCSYLSLVHTSYFSQTPQTCLCKKFLSGVNFSRLSEKKCIYLTFSETFLVFLVPLVVFWGVKFGFRKSCLCKRNDKYEVCIGPGVSLSFIGQKEINRFLSKLRASVVQKMKFVDSLHS